MGADEPMVLDDDDDEQLLCIHILLTLRWYKSNFVKNTEWEWFFFKFD